MIRALLLALAFAASPLGVDSAKANDPSGLDTLFLTWEADPLTSMTAIWLSAKSDDDAVVALEVSKDGSRRWSVVSGRRVPFGPAKLDVCRVEFTGLEPDSLYRLRQPGGADLGTFRTAPRTAEAPIRIAAGGDAGPSVATARVCSQAALRDPLFAIIGGDIAYANGKRPKRWVEFLKIWNQRMVTPDGRRIPLVVCIGNHEVDDDDRLSREEAPYFYALFELFIANGYACLDFGTYLSLILLDTHHTTPVPGYQTRWLAEALLEREHFPHLFAIYHVPAFPSHRPLDGSTSKRIRQHWLPLFDRHGVDVAFEAHDHTYKRSPLIFNGKASHSSNGTLFLGDGAWGVRLREVKDAREHWYLNASASKNHFTLTEIHGAKRTHVAIDDRGRVFDSYPGAHVEVQVTTEPTVLGDSQVYAIDQTVKATARTARAAHTLEEAPTGTIEFVLEHESGWQFSLGSFLASPKAIELSFRMPWPGRYELSAIGEMDDTKPARPFAVQDLASFYSVDPTPRAAIQAEQTQPGLRATTFEGPHWRKLPDFAELKPISSQVVPGISLEPLKTRETFFGVVFDGLFHATKEGWYQFFLTSCDGSRLEVGSHRVIDNDGRHPERTVARWIKLGQGLHPLRVEYFQARGPAKVSLEVAGPGSTRAAVQPEALSHDATSEVRRPRAL